MARTFNCREKNTGHEQSVMACEQMIPNNVPWWIQLFDYLAPHWWGISAITIAPLVGFAATRRYRVHSTSNPSNFQLASISGTVTFVLSLLMWWKGYRDIEGAVLVAIIMGIGYPIAFTAIMGVMHKWWPWGFERLSGQSAGAARTTANDKGKSGMKSGNSFFPRW